MKPAYPGEEEVRGLPPRVPSTTRLLLVVWEVRSGSFPLLVGNYWQLPVGPGGHGLAGTTSLGEAGLQKGKGLWAALVCPHPYPAWDSGAWGVSLPHPGLGTHLKWPCVESGWGGPAGAASGTCPHLVSPAGGLGEGTHPSCSGTAGTVVQERGTLLLPLELGLAVVRLVPGCLPVTWYRPGASWTGVVLFQPSSPYASRRPGCPRSLESPFLPGGHGG